MEDGLPRSGRLQLAVSPDGIVLTGTRGAGKSAIARALDAAGIGAYLRSVTTRSPRGDDAGHYDYLTALSFDEEAEAGQFLVVAQYGAYKYAVRVQETLKASEAGVPPILTLTPAAAVSFFRCEDRLAWRGVFVDAPDDILDARLTARSVSADPPTLVQRALDRSTGTGTLPVVVNDRSLEEAVEAVVAALGFPSVSA